ncbi:MULTISPECIES: hypothetical protein [unclassified Cytobacillus]|uniref:hypothetical protein n=1 Tax=unclassified Cytobacillus TaxID=2675268 RepID=UPI001357D909|nr:hypothetical protein [Cytobacillus sp. AMY 15.2]MCM3089787.1 hypothetical protein [Cytobacillus sp. AMY 15.2]
MKKDNINEGIDNQNGGSQDILMNRVNQVFDRLAEEVRGMVDEGNSRMNKR